MNVVNVTSNASLLTHKKSIQFQCKNFANHCPRSSVASRFKNKLISNNSNNCNTMTMKMPRHVAKLAFMFMVLVFMFKVQEIIQIKGVQNIVKNLIYFIYFSSYLGSRLLKTRL